MKKITRKNKSMQKTDDIRLNKLSKNARINKMNPHAQHKILNEAKNFFKETPKKQKKTITMIPKEIAILQALSEEWKIPQGDVVGKLLEKAADQHFKDNLYDRFKSY